MGRVRLTRRISSAVALMVLAALLAGCHDDSTGPLELRGHGGEVIDPVESGVWFRVSGCLVSTSKPVDVMVTGITTSHVSDHVTTRVAWNDDSPIELAKPGQPPANYQHVTATSHTGGTLVGCSLNVAVVLSPDAAPVVVRTVTVNYQVDGKKRSARIGLEAVLCPAGTHAGDTSGTGGPDDSCRDAHNP